MAMIVIALPSHRTVSATSMPPVLSRPTPVPFDPNWAQSLCGLHLLVPSNWWPGYSSDNLNNAVVVDVDFAQPEQRFFKIIVDGHDYYMRYDAVFTYANSSQRGFQRFHLPRHPVTNPEGEECWNYMFHGAQTYGLNRGGTDKKLSSAILLDRRIFENRTIFLFVPALFSVSESIQKLPVLEARPAREWQATHLNRPALGRINPISFRRTDSESMVTFERREGGRSQNNW